MDNERILTPVEIAQNRERKMLMLATNYIPFITVIRDDPFHGIGIGISSLSLFEVQSTFSGGELSCLLIPSTQFTFEPQFSRGQHRFAKGLKSASLYFEEYLEINGRPPHCRYGVFRSEDLYGDIRIILIYCRGRLRAAFLLCRSYTNNAVYFRWGLDRRMAHQRYNALR